MGEVAICSHSAGPGRQAAPWNPECWSGGALRLPGGKPPDPTPRNPPMASGPIPPSRGLGPAGPVASRSGSVAPVARGTGRLGVADVNDDVITVGEAGHAAQGALSAGWMVPQPAFLGGPAGHPDG